MIDEKIFVYPTDTVWGIGANIFSEDAQIEIAKIKGTEFNKPLSVLFNSLEQLEKYVKLPEVNFSWEEFFAIETTLLIEKERFPKVPRWICHESPLVGIRMLQNEATEKINALCKDPITSTSLNLTGEPVVQKKEEARAFVEDHCPQAHIVDDCTFKMSGASSTIVAYQKDQIKIIREGDRVGDVKNVLGL